MLSLLRVLAPINCIKAGDIWFYELDDINEVLFVMDGKFGIGYEINRTKRYHIEINACSIIGSVEVSYDRRSLYIYKALTNIEGFFMTKINWKYLK